MTLEENKFNLHQPLITKFDIELEVPQDESLMILPKGIRAWISGESGFNDDLTVQVAYTTPSPYHTSIGMIVSKEEIKERFDFVDPIEEPLLNGVELKFSEQKETGYSMELLIDGASLGVIEVPYQGETKFFAHLAVTDEEIDKAKDLAERLTSAINKEFGEQFFLEDYKVFFFLAEMYLNKMNHGQLSFIEYFEYRQSDRTIY